MPAKKRATRPDRTQPAGIGRSVVISRSPEHVTFYANHAGVTLTPWDFSLRFGQISEASGEKIVLTEALSVFMSPQHMLAFRDLVNNQVAKYEATYGPIPAPRTDTEA